MRAELSARVFLRKVKRSSVSTAVNILIDTLLCVATFFMITFLVQTMIISLLLSLAVGVVCVVRYDGFKKFFKKIDQSQLTQSTVRQLKGYENLFNKNSLILCVLDFVTTAIIILTIGLFVQEQAAGLVANFIRVGILSVRATNNAIQFGKLVRALRAIAIVSGAYAIVRNKNYLKGGGIVVEKIKAFFKYIFVSNPITFFCGLLSVTLLIVNGATGNVIADTLLGWLEDPTTINATFYTILGGLGASGAIFGGIESNKTADKRKAVAAEIKEQTQQEAEIKKMIDEKLKAEQDALRLEREQAIEAEIRQQLNANAESVVLQDVVNE